MRKLFLIFFFSALLASRVMAEDNVDKTMAKISRDTETYVSADARTNSTTEAYNMAVKSLCEKLTALTGKKFNPNNPPTTMESLTSKISDDRYRVLVYVRKSDLGLESLPGDRGSKSNEELYEDSRLVVEEDAITDTSIKEKSVLDEIALQGSKDEFIKCMERLRKTDTISGAAAFPIAHADDFYVAVIDGNAVRNILHCINGQFYDLTSKEVDIHKYAHCTGYWFTITKQ